MHPDAESLLQRNKAHIERLCVKYAVKRLRLFGSALTPEWKAGSSDIDLLAEYGPERNNLPPLDALVGLQMDLERVLGVKVDVVDWKAARNPFFRRQVEAQAQELYAP